MTDLEDVLALIDGATIVADTSSLILAKGENPGGTEVKTVEVLEMIASRLGGRTERRNVAPDRPNLSIKFGPDEPGILFLGHSDVVPEGTGWQVTNAFMPRVVDGKLYGRGAVDMKGGLAAIMQAAAAVTQVDPSVPIEILVTADEEDLSLGMRRELQEAARDYLCCIVGEPTNMATVVACRGAANFRVTVHGKAAHAGRPEDGVNAITAASRIALLIAGDHERLRAGAKGLLGSASWSIGRIQGGHGTSIVPDLCEILVDRRLMPHESGADAMEGLNALIQQEHTLDGCSTSVEQLMEMPGFETEADHPLTQDVVKALELERFESPVEAWTAACEGGFVHQHHGCPVVIMGPGDIRNQAHQPDECVPIADLELAARAYARVAMSQWARRGEVVASGNDSRQDPN
ncbi:MAG TPA: M20/M25/M40 family metallo-hydrolase [Candidatus Agrococcus pullicola]|uniref:M20/M25/M40 family metallo-hydrolase n=1 Tax=Candidatus Agrococcus pullicola TaxID=2838429 RepID=A0A9D1YVL7_9MICO|nr:M20/M25/M40 family metallo-hydrolase [Candidatus Agrococcus pullicola]